jgi:hypothetical protein
MLFISVFLLSCGLKNIKDKTSASPENIANLQEKSVVKDSIISRNFEIAYNNKSTAPSYIVFKAVDINTLQVKVICCEAPFLSGAMHREYKKDYDENSIRFIDSLVLNNEEKLFRFKDKSALENISFQDYPDSIFIENEKKKYNIDQYIKKFTNTDSTETVHFSDSENFVQVVFAHIMFENGIITRRDCMAGNNLHIGTLKD